MTARIYYYPEPGGALKAIDLQRPLTTIKERPARREFLEESWSGRRTTATTDAFTAVELVHAQFDEHDVARELEVLENFLQGGGIIAIAEDEGVNFGGYLQTAPAAGGTSITVFANQWSAWGSITTGANDVVVVQGPAPVFKREPIVVTDRTGLTATLESPGLRYDYTEQAWVFVRDKRFWPYLRLQKGAKGRELLTHDHRLSFDFIAPLEEVQPLLDLGAESFDTEWGTENGEPTYHEIDFSGI